MPRQPTNDPVLIAIGQTLREIREAKAITQTDLAAKLSRKQAAIAQWELGRRCPAVRELPLIADALGMDRWKFAKKIFEKISDLC